MEINFIKVLVGLLIPLILINGCETNDLSEELSGDQPEEIFGTYYVYIKFEIDYSVNSPWNDSIVETNDGKVTLVKDPTSSFAAEWVEVKVYDDKDVLLWKSSYDWLNGGWLWGMGSGSVSSDGKQTIGEYKLVSDGQVRYCNWNCKK